MIFDPYIVKNGESIRRLFVQIPHLSDQQPWKANINQPTQIITLDISIQDKKIHVLLGSPDWNSVNITYHIETICSNLLMLMQASGLCQDRTTVQWYQIIHTSQPLLFRKIEFGNDSEIWLSDVSWIKISIDELPFNVERYSKLIERQVH